MAKTANKVGRPRRAQPRWGEASLSQEDQHRLRRDALFRTAARVFKETGYYNTTLDEVARRLHVTKPTLYYYVKDKDDILFECHRLALLHMKDALLEAESGDQSGVEKLKDFLASYTELMSNDFGACLMRTGLQALKPESRAKLRGLAVKLNNTLRTILERGVEDGSIRSCDPKMVAHAIFGGFNGIAQWYKADGALEPKEVNREFVDLYLQGLRPEPAANRGPPRQSRRA